MTTATDYRLALDKTAAGLEATWILPEGVGARFVIAPGLTPEELAEHRWYLEEYLVFPGPGDHVRARAFEQRLEGLGQSLYRALFHDGVDVLRDLVAAPGPRVLTLRSEDADALAQPWELLRDARSALVFRDVVIRRQLAAAGAAPRAVVPALPLRILLVIARPTDAGAIDARSSAGPMLDALDALGGLVHVDLCDPPTLAELERRLGEAKDRYHIVHFDGHGVYLPDLGVGALCFEKLDATKELVVGRDLGDLLARMAVPLVVLEACQTADLSGGPVFGSVAPALLRSGVGSVIAFSHSVLVSTARILVERFYQSLCKGKSIGAALNDGRCALHGDPVRHRAKQGDLTLRDWHIAQLYQAGADPVLVPAGAAFVAEGTEPLQRGLAPGKELEAEPMYGFHGRADELLVLQRKLRKHHAVVVQGGGGMGKTSLAREAARWWHRVGLRPGGAAFFSFESRQGAERAVQAFVQYVEGERFVQGSPEALWARAVGYFREREVLWVWDNFETTLPQFQKGRDAGMALFEDDEQDRLRRLFGELTSGKPRGWLLVTCRPEGTGLPGIAEMTLGGLTRGDALEMAREVLARKDLKVGAEGYEREKIEALIDAVERHPLSIELVMAHLGKVRPAEAVKDLRGLVAVVSQEAGEERNKGLLASLRWSTGRLSEEARGVLPYLAWFDGGAFEAVIEAFCEVGPEVWGRVREELLAMALVRVEDRMTVAEKPYLAFHPTLPYAAEPTATTDKAQKRFVGLYHQVAATVYKAFVGTEPGAGMAVMNLEERNLRRATALAFGLGAFVEGARLSDAIGSYLLSLGRTSAHARFAAWAQQHMAKATGPAKWAVERDHAVGLLRSGQLREAVTVLERQLEAIDTTGGGAQEQALCYTCLGIVWVTSDQPQCALGPLEKAINGFEAVGDHRNLAAALGTQANALKALGRLPEALESAERALGFTRKLGDVRGEATSLGLIAVILGDQYRFSEAERRYEEALETAYRAHDTGLEHKFLQNFGTLFRKQGQYARAVTLYKGALARYQAIDDVHGEMQTADLLGTVEMELGHHEAARAWYTEAHRLARELGDEMQIGGTAQNVGILLQRQALALPLTADGERLRLLGEAIASVGTSLDSHRKRGDEVRAAASVAQLGQLHLQVRALNEAERYMYEALAFFEPRNLPDVWQIYSDLEDLALARDRPEEAATWRAKKEAKLTQLERLVQGRGPSRLQPALCDAFVGICDDIHAALTAGQPLPSTVLDPIAYLATQPDPLGAGARFLRRITAGELTEPPPDLPPELREIFTGLVESLRRGG